MVSDIMGHPVCCCDCDACFVGDLSENHVEEEEEEVNVEESIQGKGNNVQSSDSEEEFCDTSADLEVYFSFMYAFIIMILRLLVQRGNHRITLPLQFYVHLHNNEDNQEYLMLFT